MQSKSLLKLIVFAVIAVLAGEIYYYYPLLPQKMATHFNASGEVNGWSDKSTFFLFMIGIFVVVMGILGAITVWLDKMPVSLFNLPNKEYWFAEERRASTFRLIKKYMNFINIGTAVFLLFMLHLTIVANLKPKPVLDSEFWLIFIFYFIGVVGYSLYLIMYFNRIPPE